MLEQKDAAAAAEKDDGSDPMVHYLPILISLATMVLGHAIKYSIVFLVPFLRPSSQSDSVG